MTKRYQNCYEFIGALTSGTHVSHTSSSNTSVMVSIGREKCDIIVNDSERKISRHHADVELKAMTGNKYYIFTDCSANGSIVNGRNIKKQSVNIPVGGSCPEIYLAGVKDGKLNWSEVVSELDKRARAIQNVEDAESSSAQKIVPLAEPTNDANDEDIIVYEPEDATGWLVAAYIFAILGGLLGIAFGVMIYSQKVNLTNGEKVHKYKDSHRQLGLVAAILAGISMLIWKFAIG